jgi:hypothetical protein
MKLGIQRSTACEHALQICFGWSQSMMGNAAITLPSLLHLAGLQRLSALQRLEVLHVPCHNPHAVARLAAQLPRLRSLLRCCSAPGLKASTHDLVLTAATALTELRLHLSTAFADAMQQLLICRCCNAAPGSCWPVSACIPVHVLAAWKTVKSTVNIDPTLQALDVTILNNKANMEDAVMALVNSLPLQVGLSAHSGMSISEMCQVQMLTL